MTILKRPSFRQNIKAGSVNNEAPANNNSLTAGQSKGHGWRQKLDKLQNSLLQRWQSLPSRDRMALSLLVGFLLLFLGGYGGYNLHEAANKSETAYNESIANYFWLRGQASHISPDANSQDANGQPADIVVSTLLKQSGINNPEVMVAGESVQLSFTTDSQAIVGRALGNLQQQGWQFTRLNIQQDSTSKQLQVQATLTK